MAVRVVSLPAAINRRKNGPRSSGGIASPSTSACTSVVVRSFSGSSRRCLPSQSPYARGSRAPCRRDSRVPPKSRSPPARSRLVRSSSFARSPSGTPIMSQMIATGSASATSVTNSASPFGAMVSTIRRARCRTAPSAFAIIFGVKPRFTTPRSLVCFGGSVEIIDRMAPMYCMSSGSVIAWIPYAELKVSQSRVAAATSSKRVMDQKPLPESGCWCQATGRSCRSLAKAPSTSSRSQKSKLAGLISSRERAVVGVGTVLIGGLLVTADLDATVYGIDYTLSRPGEGGRHARGRQPHAVREQRRVRAAGAGSLPRRRRRPAADQAGAAARRVARARGARREAVPEAGAVDRGRLRPQGGLPMRMAGKIGIVTAAASGMGRAGALRFAREGAQIAVVDVDADGVKRVVGAITSAGGIAHGIAADLTKDDDSRRIVWDTVDRFKGLDFVWNHVGHPGPASVEGIDLGAFDLAVDLNLRTVLLTTEAAIPEMRARGGGSLLFTASTSGLVGSGFSPVYSMCKFGVVGFVKSLALRLAKENIRVNAVCPGPIDTPMLRVFVARPDQKATVMDPEQLVQSRAHGSVPLGRTGKPEEIANA